MKFIASEEDAWLRNDESIIGWITWSIRFSIEPILATMSGAWSGLTRITTLTLTRISNPSRLITESGLNSWARWMPAGWASGELLPLSSSAQSMVRFVVGMM